MVIIGFGEYKDYKLQEIPDEFLNKLAQSYSLCHAAHDASGKDELRATIAVHEELQRRAKGGKISKRLPFRKEIATKLIGAGFRHLSKEYHPDRAGGDDESQKALSGVRDYLLSACGKIPEPERKGAFMIQDPDPLAQSAEISDDDIPF
jgi:hypothetical protein